MRIVLPFLTAFLLFAIDAAIFRTGVYSAFLEPASFAGQFLGAIRNARAPRTCRTKPILVLGDSRINEGFSAKIADALAPTTCFISAGVPGASLRAFHYILREADPHRDAYSTIVLPVDDYDDEDGPYDRDDDTQDIHLVVPALRLSDIPQFVASFRNWDSRWEILRQSLFKGLVYKEDTRAFLSDPPSRIAAAKAFRQHGSEWQYDYQGSPNSLEGLTWNPATHTLVIPPRIAPEIQAQLISIYTRGPSPQTGHYKHHRQDWFRCLLEPYLHMPTRIVVIRLPRNPLPAPHYANNDPDSAVRSLRSQPAVTVEDEHTFDSLEQPAYFADAIHMNASGRKVFSAALAKLLLARP